MKSDTEGRADPLRTVDHAFDLLFDVGPLAMARFDADLRLERVNRRLSELLGRPVEELLEMSLEDLTHPDDRAGYARMARKAFGGEIPYFTTELRYRSAEDQAVWVKHTATFVTDETGAVISGVAMVEDIAERKEGEARVAALNAELEARVAELEAVNRELEVFSSHVSHDLKGPLVSIGQFSAILLSEEKGSLNEEQHEMLRRIRGSGHRAKHIIDDLRDLADVTRREVFAEDVDLSALCWEIAEDLRLLAPERDVRFEFRPDLQVYADPALVRLLMTNLLQNAWKYSAPRERVTIEVGVEEGPLRTVFFVRDNGIGFDNQHREKIFEVFERLHSDEFAGTGLGLATAKRIVNRHGGDIWAEGVPGEGATFWFTVR